MRIDYRFIFFAFQMHHLTVICVEGFRTRLLLNKIVLYLYIYSNTINKLTVTLNCHHCHIHVRSQHIEKSLELNDYAPVTPLLCPDRHYYPPFFNTSFALILLFFLYSRGLLCYIHSPTVPLSTLPSFRRFPLYTRALVYAHYWHGFPKIHTVLSLTSDASHDLWYIYIYI